MSSRVETIEALVQSAIEGMAETADEKGATNDEVLSAYFTLMRRGVNAALSMSVDRKQSIQAMRQSLYTILADLSDSKVH